MIDCGFSPRQAQLRLGRLGLTPHDIDAVFLTHEHSDHIAGVARFAARFDIPVYSTAGTWSAAQRHVAAANTTITFRPLLAGSPISIADIEIEPYAVPHDAAEPVQYVFSDGDVRLGVLTDCGHVTEEMRVRLSACEALVLECNHDSAMLANGAYPSFLKTRVGGDLGHLSNAQAAYMLSAIDCSKLRHVVAAHLSEKNNRPALARAALASSLGCSESWIGIADQELGFEWRTV